MCRMPRPIHVGLFETLVPDSFNIYFLTSDGIHDIQSWLTKNWLCLNAPKTDMANIVSSRRSGTIPGIEIDNVWIPKSESVQDLGVWLDQGMPMGTQVQMMCKAAYANLYKIGRIRKFLDRKSAERLVHALVISRLDTNNAVLFGLPDKTLAPMQRVLNSAARLVCRRRKFDTITPLLRELHWLPVWARVNYKILTLVHKVLNGCGPAYLSTLLVPNAGRTRSTTLKALQTQNTKNKNQVWRPQFLCMCPTPLEQSPSHLRTLPEHEFKKQLKTHLFGKCYGEVAP